jgi:hypothetical protein
MTAPAGYRQTAPGGWVKESDRSGPYTVNAGQGTTNPSSMRQLPAGWWVAPDGSGPYFRDVTAGTVTAIFTVGT